MAHRKMEMLRARKRLNNREIVFGQSEKVKREKQTISHCLRSLENCPQLRHDFSRSQEEKQAKFQKKSVHWSKCTLNR